MKKEHTSDEDPLFGTNYLMDPLNIVETLLKKEKMEEEEILYKEDNLELKTEI